MEMLSNLRQTDGQRSLIGVSALLWSVPPNLATTSLAVLVGRQGTAFQVSLVTMSHFLALLLFAPVWGAIADVTGKHRSILLGTGVAGSACLFVLGLTEGSWARIFLRGLYAVFFAAFPPLMLTIVSEHGGLDGRGRALGNFNGWRSVGLAAGQFFAGISLAVLVYYQIYFALGVVNLAAVAVTLFVSNPVPERDVKPRLATVWREISTRLYPASDARAHLVSNGLHWMYVAVLFQSITFFGLLSLLPVYITENVGISEALMGVFLAVNPLSRTVLMVVFGTAVDRFGRKPVLSLGMLGTGVFAVVTAVATAPPTLFVRKLVMAVAFLVIAVSFSAAVIGSQTFIGDVADVGRESELMGLRTSALGLGGVVGPLLVGGLVTLSNYELAFGLMSTFAFAGTVLIVEGVVETGPDPTPAEKA